MERIKKFHDKSPFIDIITLPTLHTHDIHMNNSIPFLHISLPKHAEISTRDETAVN